MKSTCSHFTKILFLSLFLFFLSNTSFAQLPLVKGEQYSIKERLFFGGNLGLGFGNIVSTISVDPLIGAMLTHNISVGIQGTYTYINWRRFNVDDQILGYRAFARRTFDFDMPNFLGGGQLLLQGEVERLRVQYPTLDANFNVVQTRGWIPGVLAGPGIFYPNRNRGGFHLIVLYNFQHDIIRSPYGSEFVFRTGFIF
jgi:hypothetical protein